MSPLQHSVESTQMYFFVEIGRLIGLIVFEDGICIDLLKIEAILALPPHNNVTELQSLQGKEFFLHRFVCKYAKKTHGFMHLLKKNTHFFWDNLAQHAFKTLKHAIMHVQHLHPPTYTREYSLYMVA